jgi:2-haloacid dehalogenase
VELAITWRRTQLELSWLRTAMGTFADFDVVTSDALDAAVASLQVSVSSGGRQVLSAAFNRLPAQDGAAEALRALQAAGIGTGVLTNGSRRTMGEVLERTALASLTDPAVSADSVRRFKPHPAVYRMASEATGLDPGRIGFVTANGWDAAGAGALGFRVAWLRPAPDARLPSVGAPDPLIASWASLPEAFTATSADSSG